MENVIVQITTIGSESMLKPQRISLEELSQRLREYERQYGYPTIEFYRRFENGELGDDAGVLTWVGLCHLYFDLFAYPSV